MKKESCQNNISKTDTIEEELYIPEANLNRVAVIDTATWKTVRYISIGDILISPLGCKPTVLIAIPNGSKIYSDNFRLVPPAVLVINRLAQTVKSIIVDSVPLGIFHSSDGKEIYVTEGNCNVEVISTETDEVIRCLSFVDIPVACASGPNGNLYIGFANGTLCVYDSNSGNLLRDPILTGGILPNWLTLAKDGKKLYAGIANTIVIIDTENWKLVKTILISGKVIWQKDIPYSFTSALSPNGKKLYVALIDFGVIVIDIVSNEIIKTIETTGSATGIVFSSNGKRGYICEMGSSFSFSKVTVERTVLGKAWKESEISGNGQVIIFDTENDNTIEIPIIIGPALGIPVLVPYASSYLIF